MAVCTLASTNYPRSSPRINRYPSSHSPPSIKTPRSQQVSRRHPRPPLDPLTQASLIAASQLRRHRPPQLCWLRQHWCAKNSKISILTSCLTLRRLWSSNHEGISHVKRICCELETLRSWETARWRLYSLPRSNSLLNWRIIKYFTRRMLQNRSLICLKVLILLSSSSHLSSTLRALHHHIWIVLISWRKYLRRVILPLTKVQSPSIVRWAGRRYQKANSHKVQKNHVILCPGGIQKIRAANGGWFWMESERWSKTHIWLWAITAGTYSESVTLSRKSEPLN